MTASNWESSLLAYVRKLNPTKDSNRDGSVCCYILRHEFGNF